MKKFVENLRFVAIVLVLLLPIGLGIFAEFHTERFYTIKGVVTAIESATDSVVFENPDDGNIWAFTSSGVYDWAVGDPVVAIMADNATKQDITDDSICSVVKNRRF